MASFKEIAQAMADYHIRTQKRPTYLYAEPKLLNLLVQFPFTGDKVLGLEIVWCDELPLGKKEFFVCG